MTKYLKKDIREIVKNLIFILFYCIEMANLTEVKEMYEICDGCERNQVREITDLCKTCVYNTLRTKFEEEHKNQKTAEEK